MSYGTPGVYVEESNPRLSPIIEAGTGVSGMLGFTTRGPVHKPIALSSFDDFQRVFGKSHTNETAEYAVKGFFDNGGSKLYFSRLSNYNTATGVENGAASSFTLDLDGVGNTLKIKAGYRGVESPGVDGDNVWYSLNLDPQHPSDSKTTDFTADSAVGESEIRVAGTVGIKAGSLLKLSDVSAGTFEIVQVRRVNSASSGGVVTHTVYLEAPLVAAIDKTDATCESLEYTIIVMDATGLVLETWSQLSFVGIASNNLDLIINDPQLGSRYITTTTVMDGATPAKGDLSTTIAGNASLATGVKLANGTAENTGATAAMFAGSELIGKGIHALDPLTDISLIMAPPTSNKTANTWGVLADTSYHSLLLAYAEERMDLFAILDVEAGMTAAQAKVYRSTTLGLDSFWGALYYPQLKIQDPNRPQTSATLVVPPSGYVAGIYSRVDGLPAPQGGVSAAPAGISDFGQVKGILGVELLISDKQQATLNPIGVNCIRLLDRAQGGKGVFVFGARTLSTDSNFRYVPMRRTLTYVEESIRLSTQFGIFKKNGPELWSELSAVIVSFLRGFWRDGNLAGNSEAEAFFVEIDSNTTTADDINNGIIRGRIGVSLHRPAEFIVFTFTQTQNGSSVEEEG
jgi:uncharacterized protein